MTEDKAHLKYASQQMTAHGMFSCVEDYYARYRPTIPQSVVDEVLALSSGDVTAGALLDLGTGTGQVVMAMAPRFTRILAIELDAGMLRRAEEDWRQSPFHDTVDVDWVQSDVDDYLVPDEVSVTLVTACRAFHWMDQASVLNRYSEQTGPLASFAVFGDSSFWESRQDWAVATRETVQRYLGDKRRARSTTFKHHKRPYAEIVAESPFADVRESVVDLRRQWTTEQVLGYLYSTTFAAKDLFGARIDEFETALLDVLAGFLDPDGLLQEDARFQVVVGSKPGS